MRLQRAASIVLMVILALTVRSGVCSAQEYAGFVIDPQAMQGIKRVLVAWNKGNASYSAAQQAVKLFEEYKLKNVQATPWDGKPFDLGAFDALVVIEAFSINESRRSGQLYTKDERIVVPRFDDRRGADSSVSRDTYSSATLSARVEAAWVTLYLMRVEFGPPNPGSSSTPRSLGPIIYINSDGGGWFSFDDPSEDFFTRSMKALMPPGITTSYISATRSLFDSLVKDMKSIDPQNWQ